MGIFKKRSTGKLAENDRVRGLLELAMEDLVCGNYTRLSDDPTISAGLNKIAGLVGQVTWKILENTNNGNNRIKNELSRMIDITPNTWQTRRDFFSLVTKILLIHGNAIVHVRTQNGYLRELEPIAPERVAIIGTGRGNQYQLIIDGTPRNPEDFLHFKLNPDVQSPYKGEGIKVQLKDIAYNLKQANYTTRKFLESKWKPALIVSVDAISDQMKTKEGRQKIANEYLKTSEIGEPWIVPAAQMNVQNVKPLTLHDLAISDTVRIDKQTAAAVLGLPAFMLGVGEFEKEEYNNFIDTQIKGIVEAISQELTRKIISSPKWYIKGSVWSLKAWDLQEIANVMTTYGDRGWVSGNEGRDKIDFEPVDGLDERKVLENYIPIDMSGMQKKLTGGN